MRIKWAAGAIFLLGMLSSCAQLPPVIVGRDPLTAQEHQNLGDAYLAHGEKVAAETQYEGALHSDSHFTPALIALGNIAYDESSWKQAEAYFKRAMKSAPNDAGAANNLAMTFLAEGKHLDRARQLVDRFLPAAGPLKPYMLDTSAMIALHEGRYTDADRALDQAAAAAPPGDSNFLKQLADSRRKLAAKRLESDGIRP